MLTVLSLSIGCSGDNDLSRTPKESIPIPTPPPLAGQTPKDLVKTLKNAKPKAVAPVGKLGGPPKM
jgi:hypothetical protein